jgi:ribosomal protein S18 acetylase RimI-like enzyme
MTPNPAPVVHALAVAGMAWYLSIIGVSPAAQGLGVGRGLVQTTLAEADHAGAACFLETFVPRNLAFYERLGFGVVTSHKEPVTSEEYFIMHRTPTARLS